MTTPKTHDGETQRPMNADELAVYKITQADSEAQAQAEADRQALKSATLAKLGLTAEEVTALLS